MLLILHFCFDALNFAFFDYSSALRLGLPYVPTYLGQTGSVEDMIHGVNYASAGAGLIFTSGSELVNSLPPFIPLFFFTSCLLCVVVHLN